MKKTLIIFIVFITLLTGCNSDSDKNTLAKCEVFDCINKIEPENTVKEINEIIGFDGEVTDEKYKIYYWELSDDEGVQVAYYSSDKSQIKLKYDKDVLEDKKVNVSKLEELKEELKKGVKITYDDLVKQFKTKGTLVGKSSITKKYTWVDDEGSYATATIDNKTNRCTVLNGKID